VQEHEIPEDYKIVVYRVMQEALTNAAKHSKADTINIRLKKDAGCLELEVEDNGCGFNPRQAFEGGDGLSGYGLRSMQERAEICGGSISVYSRPGAGTHIRAALPVSKIFAER
jgi:signal transduction histidine kinase